MRNILKIFITLFLLLPCFNVLAAKINYLQLDFYKEIEKSIRQLEIDVPEEELWHILKKKHHVDERLDDKDARSKYVLMQAAVENAIVNLLKNKKITSAIGVIHTPHPASPLRINEDDLSEGIIDKQIQQDPKRLATVLIRPKILRNYLTYGGKLYALYPQDSLDLKIPGIEHYRSLLKEFPNLIDKPVKFFGEELTGASYIIKSKKGQFMFFSIKSFQANKERFNEHWGIWLGPLNDPKIKERLHQVDHYFKDNHIDLLKELK